MSNQADEMLLLLLGGIGVAGVVYYYLVIKKNPFVVAAVVQSKQIKECDRRYSDLLRRSFGYFVDKEEAWHKKAKEMRLQELPNQPSEEDAELMVAFTIKCRSYHPKIMKSKQDMIDVLKEEELNIKPKFYSYPSKCDYVRHGFTGNWID